MFSFFLALSSPKKIALLRNKTRSFFWDFDCLSADVRTWSWNQLFELGWRKKLVYYYFSPSHSISFSIRLPIAQKGTFVPSSKNIKSIARTSTGCTQKRIDFFSFFSALLFTFVNQRKSICAQFSIVPQVVFIYCLLWSPGCASMNQLTSHCTRRWWKKKNV